MRRRTLDETVVGIVAYSEGKKVKLGGLPMKCALIFTTSRLIVAKIASFLTMIAPIVPVVGSAIANLATKNPSELAALSPEEIIKSDKNNYSLPYSGIKKVQIMHGTFPNERWGAMIWTAKDRYNYLIYTREDSDRFLDLVRTTMPEVEVALPKNW